MAQVIATVTKLSGEAFVRAKDGTMRQLKVGDVIKDNEAVVSTSGDVALKLVDGRDLNVRPGETVQVDSEVAAVNKPDAIDSAVNVNPQQFQKITKAISKTGSLDALLDPDAPAAGAVGGSGNEGHTFVEFLRVVETVDPLAYQFSTLRTAPEFELRPAAL